MKSTFVFSLVALAIANAVPSMAADSINASKEDFQNADDYIIKDVTQGIQFTTSGDNPQTYYALYGIWAQGHDVVLSGNQISIDVTASGKQHTSGQSWRGYGIYAVNQSDHLVALGNPNSTLSLDVDSDTLAIGVVGANSGTVNLNGQSITVNVNSTASEARAFEISGGTVVNLGSSNTDLISVTSMGDSNSMGLFALKGGQINVEAKEFNLTTNGYYGLLAQNNTELETAPKNTSRIVINADKTVINSLATDGAGIMAFSNGYVEINGDLEVNAVTAIDTRGNATININQNGDSTVVLKGAILFETPGDSKNSGNIIDSNVNINLTGEDSSWTGDLVKLYPTAHQNQDKYTKVDNFNLTLSDGAKWNVVSYAGVVPETEILENQQANFLTLDGGIINTADAKKTIEVGTLTITAKGGTFNAQTVKEGEGFATSKMAVQNVAAESAGSLAVKYTGITSDDLTEENVKTLVAVTGDVQKVETVEEGDIKGVWTRTTNADGETTEDYGENTKLSSYSSITAMSLVQWRNEINHLTKRLGDIRASESTIGAWARVYGGASEWGSNPEVDMDHTTIQVGGDYRINPNWIVGGAFSYTDSDAESGNGFADGESYSLAAYATYLADNGSFLDMIARYGYLKNDITAGNMALETKNNAFSLSVEGGHQFRFIEDRAYIEPQIELTYGFVSGDDADASNGVRIEQDDYQNLITRVGVRTGFDFPEKAGTIYATLSYSYDFLGDADGTASGQTEAGYESVALTEDLGGGWVTYGVGAQFRLGDNAFAYGELERTSGGDIDNPYLFNVGFRYNF